MKSGNNNGGDVYTPAHTPENYNNDNNTNKASVAVIWMVVELMNYGKKRKEKYVHVSHSDCPHKLLFLCVRYYKYTG